MPFNCHLIENWLYIWKYRKELNWILCVVESYIPIWQSICEIWEMYNMWGWLIIWLLIWCAIYHDFVILGKEVSFNCHFVENVFVTTETSWLESYVCCNILFPFVYTHTCRLGGQREFWLNSEHGICLSMCAFTELLLLLEILRTNCMVIAILMLT